MVDQGFLFGFEIIGLFFPFAQTFRIRYDEKEAKGIPYAFDIIQTNITAKIIALEVLIGNNTDILPHNYNSRASPLLFSSKGT